jgi:prepilin signal peptidase PulO-like enzyme (type II secretory pathway)
LTPEILFFSIIALYVSYIDLKYQVIPDAIMFPAITGLFAIMLFQRDDIMLMLLTVMSIFVLFSLPILIGLPFGGGDIRFAIFVALLLPIKGVVLFLMMSGVVHILLLALSREKILGFAPSMTISAIMVYFLHPQIWSLL